MVQNNEDLPDVSEEYCINCGECVRACPAKIQVNLLVRFLEAGEYEEATDNYDLLSCIECGLCSFVCPGKIPVFQYIRFGKYELERILAEEAAAAEAEAAEAEAAPEAKTAEAENEQS